MISHNRSYTIKSVLFIRDEITNGQIDQWLASHQNIEVISTNSFSNAAGWGYIILYKERGEAHE